MVVVRSGKTLAIWKAEQSRFDGKIDNLREREASGMPSSLVAFVTGCRCHLLCSPWLKVMIFHFTHNKFDTYVTFPSEDTM